MAIRFDREFNNQLRRDVRNYNKRRDLLEKLGYKNLPKHQYVSELKNRYRVRGDLVREMERLRNFSRGDLQKQVETEGGVKAVSWQFDYVKDNRRSAKEFYEREYERVSKRIGRFPGERTYLDTISAKINLLSKDIRYMNQSEFRSAVTSINEFAMTPTRRREHYREFLNEVDWVMEKTGYTKEERDKFFRKFNKLTTTQFLYAYDNNDIIAKIYNLYHKDYGEEDGHLTTSEEDAKSAIEELIDQADEIILDAQLNSD